MSEYHYDFGNLCECFHGILKDILIALQDDNKGKAIDKCCCAMRILDKWHKKHIIRQSLKGEIK